MESIDPSLEGGTTAKLTLLVLENPWNESVWDGLSVAPFVEGLSRWARDVET